MGIGALPGWIFCLEPTIFCLLFNPCGTLAPRFFHQEFFTTTYYGHNFATPNIRSVGRILSDRFCHLKTGSGTRFLSRRQLCLNCFSTVAGRVIAMFRS